MVAGRTCWALSLRAAMTGIIRACHRATDLRPNYEKLGITSWSSAVKKAMPLLLLIVEFMDGQLANERGPTQLLRRPADDVYRLSAMLRDGFSLAVRRQRVDDGHADDVVLK